jgi:hypothetical protein
MDHDNTATKAIRLLLTPDWEISQGRPVDWALNKNKKPDSTIKIKRKHFGGASAPPVASASKSPISSKKPRIT